MNAIRQILKVENHRVTVELPADFAAEEVEVIVLPAEVMKAVVKQHDVGKASNKFQQMLLDDKTVMSDEEYDFIEEKRRALNAWK